MTDEEQALLTLEDAARLWLEVRAQGSNTAAASARVDDAMREFRRCERARRRREKKEKL